MLNMISPCGVDCSICDYYKKDCGGCFAIQGKVFWTEYTGEKNLRDLRLCRQR